MASIVEADLIHVVDVVVDPKSGGIESVWTYRTDANAKEGDAYFVPLGPRAVVGFAIKAYKTSEEKLGFSAKQLKSVLNPIQGLSLPEPLMALVGYVAEETLCPYSLALAAATPPGVRERLVNCWRLKDIEEMPHLTPLEKEVLRTLQEMGGVLIQKAGQKPTPSTLRALKQLRGKQVVEQVLQLRPIEERKVRTEMIRLTPDTERIEGFLKTEGKRKPAQALTLMRLQTGEPAPLTPGELKALSGITDSTIKAMVEGGLLEKVEVSKLKGKAAPTPNQRQAEAIRSVVEAIDTARYEPFLLYGVTGSGKTEVYLRAAAEVLKKGRQVLYLVPEIALATQAIFHLRERFGESVALIHSELSARDRLETWMKIRDGKLPIVLGARSALFAPLTNIGLIIVDEEHENSYKQESAPRYHAKRLALFLGQQHGAAVVLGSATPSIESYFEAQEHGLRMLTLPERTASAKLPTVEIVDLTLGYKTNAPSILSPQLFNNIESCLARGEQAILFLNRRAYSPFLMCRDCGHQFQCPRCAVSLAYSRSERRLRCHHCGFGQRPPERCPSCNGDRLNPFGVGTEKVEEAVRELFPASVVARLDRDVAKRKGALEDILAKFRSGDIHILVGTQMVAKGLDFPNVTLVGVIAADISLNVPDFRSAERTFQLLSQVAGRAGRGDRLGHVVIQTFNPNHISVVCAQAHDYDRFHKVTANEREQAMYPPCVRLVNAVLSGDDLNVVRSASLEVAEALQQLEDAIVLGPTECAIQRLHDRWRMHLLIKLPPDMDVQQVGAILGGFSYKDVSLVADVDPYSLI